MNPNVIRPSYFIVIIISKLCTTKVVSKVASKSSFVVTVVDDNASTSYPISPLNSLDYSPSGPPFPLIVKLHLKFEQRSAVGIGCAVDGTSFDFVFPFVVVVVVVVVVVAATA